MSEEIIQKKMARLLEDRPAPRNVVVDLTNARYQWIQAVFNGNSGLVVLRREYGPL